MRSIRLAVARDDLLRALQTLGVTRRRRFSSILPVWLHLLPDGKELQIVEDRGRVTASVLAKGTWPAAGTTVDLFLLKRAVTNCRCEVVELHAVDGAVMLWADRWHVQLNLLPFGPESSARKPPRNAPGAEADLPLFRWASCKARRAIN